MRLLVIEDDDRVADALCVALRERGYGAQRAASGSAALAACREPQPPDLALLDLGLPDVDGHELCARLRRCGLPVIVVTARGDVPSRVQALRGGADDYVVKPFALDEVLARIVAVLRRTRAPAAAAAAVVVGDVAIDVGARQVTVAGDPVALTRKEFDLLAALARAGGAAVDRQRLLLDVWQTDWPGMSRTLDVHIATLRAKVERPWLVETVRGVGYRLASGPPEG